jgi:hypothetical protein
MKIDTWVVLSLVDVITACLHGVLVVDGFDCDFGHSESSFVKSKNDKQPGYANRAIVHVGGVILKGN